MQFHHLPLTDVPLPRNARRGPELRPTDAESVEAARGRRRFGRRSIRRDGKIMVVAALLMPVLIGLAALVMDAGMMMSVQGRARTLADSAALAAAYHRMTGGSDAEVRATAVDFILTHTHIEPPPEVEVDLPPTTGNYQADPNYIEVRIKAQVETLFIQMLGRSSIHLVGARAVAGVEDVSQGARIVALKTEAHPALRVVGSGQVWVQGGVIVNSNGGGLTERGESISNGQSQTAAAVSGQSRLFADDVQVVGGVNDPTGFLPIVVGKRPPLRTGASPISDPLAHLPAPNVALGVENVDRGAAVVSNGSAQLSGGNEVLPSGEALLKPGLYDYIQITGGKVRFEPGVFVLRGGRQDALKITGGEVDGSAGVLFYNTGSDFRASDGWPDVLDSGTGLANPTGSKFGGVSITSRIRFTPLNRPGNPMHGLWLYQRRVNGETIQIAGNSSQNDLSGLIYARGALVKISGQGALNTQFVVGELEKSGNGDLVVLTDDPAPITARKVFLVE